MSWPQIVVGGLLVVVLVALAGFFLGMQLQAMRELRGQSHATEEEERRLRRQTARRLVSSGLLLVLGFLLAAGLLFLEGPAQQLADQHDAHVAAGMNVEPTEAQRAFSRLYGSFWIVFLLILLAVVLLAAFDLWATRRHSVRERRRIQADRRAMIEQQMNRLRHEPDE